MTTSRTSLLIGTATSVAILVLTGLLGLSYLGVVTTDTTATAHLTTTGDSLGVGSDVKFRGLRVGRVLSVSTGEQPSARIVLLHEYADRIPADVRARVLPGTLFGNEYVDLVGRAQATSLDDGAEIPADTSTETVRLMDTFTATQRLLSAVDPARLDAAISALADALDGRGETLRRLVDDASDLLGVWRRNEPAFYRDLDLITTNARGLAQAEPDLIAALRNSLPLARTLVDKRPQTSVLLRDGATLLAQVTTWMGSNLDPFATVLRGTAATLAVFAARAGSFELLMRKLPTVLDNGSKDVDGNRVRMDGALGLTTVSPYGPQDCPRYGPLEGANCR